MHYLSNLKILGIFWKSLHSGKQLVTNAYIQMTNKLFHKTYTLLTNYKRTKTMPPRKRNIRLHPEQRPPTPPTPPTPPLSAALEHIISQQVTNTLGNYEIIQNAASGGGNGKNRGGSSSHGDNRGPQRAILQRLHELHNKNLLWK